MSRQSRSNTTCRHISPHIAIRGFHSCHFNRSLHLRCHSIHTIHQRITTSIIQLLYIQHFAVLVYRESNWEHMSTGSITHLHLIRLHHKIILSCITAIHQQRDLLIETNVRHLTMELHPTATCIVWLYDIHHISEQHMILSHFFCSMLIQLLHQLVNTTISLNQILHGITCGIVDTYEETIRSLTHSTSTGHEVSEGFY